MEMHILYMTISNLPDPVVANTEYEVLCQVVGAQPPPIIIWSLDGAPINATSPDRLSNQGNMSTSTLAFKPTIQVHNPHRKWETIIDYFIHGTNYQWKFEL